MVHHRKGAEQVAVDGEFAGAVKRGRKGENKNAKARQGEKAGSRIAAPQRPDPAADEETCQSNQLSTPV